MATYLSLSGDQCHLVASNIHGREIQREVLALNDIRWYDAFSKGCMLLALPLTASSTLV